MFFDNFAAIASASSELLLSPRFAAMRHDRARLRCLTRATSTRRTAGTLLDRLLYADIKTYLVELLMKQDQMSMAASIESRVPVPRPSAGRVRRRPSRHG